MIIGHSRLSSAEFMFAVTGSGRPSTCTFLLSGRVGFIRESTQPGWRLTMSKKTPGCEGCGQKIPELTGNVYGLRHVRNLDKAHAKLNGAR